MMTQQLGFSILTAPLAAIDRRALSQAWYSALHLARDGRLEPLAPPRAVAGEGRFAPRSIVGGANLTRTHLTPPSPRRIKNVDSQRAGSPRETVERRATRSALARKIERAFLNPRSRVQRATFAIQGTRTRVHVTLQTSHGRTRLVAVCSPPVRGTVAQALLQARYALAARGIDLAVETTGALACM